MCSVTIQTPWADECAMTLSIYILWFSNVYVSNVVFVIPSLSNLLPQRPCQSPALGCPSSPTQLVLLGCPAVQSHDRGANDTSSGSWALEDPCSFLHLLLPLLRATQVLTQVRFTSFRPVSLPPKGQAIISWAKSTVLHLSSSTAQIFSITCPIFLFLPHTGA